MLAIAPFAGRTFRPDDLSRARPLVVMLGHRYWRTRFNGDPAVMGRTVRIDNAPAEVIGIVPAGFRPDVAVWQPFRSVPESFRGSGAPVILRLREGLTHEAARAALTEDLRSAGSGAVLGVDLSSLHEETVEGARTTLKTLSAAVAAILLLACVNVAGLLLARGATRRRELAVRASLGGIARAAHPPAPRRERRPCPGWRRRRRLAGVDLDRRSGGVAATRHSGDGRSGTEHSGARVRHGGLGRERSSVRHAAGDPAVARTGDGGTGPGGPSRWREPVASERTNAHRRRGRDRRDARRGGRIDDPELHPARRRRPGVRPGIVPRGRSGTGGPESCGRRRVLSRAPRRRQGASRSGIGGRRQPAADRRQPAGRIGRAARAGIHPHRCSA